MSEFDSQKPNNPNVGNPYAGPQNTSSPVTYQPAHTPDGGDSTGGLIPYKNPKALIAYYLGILSGLPLIGLPLGIAAFVLGVMGLNDRKKNPAIKGSVHAGIGIGCGLVFTLLWGGLILVGIVAAISASSVRR